MRGVAGPGAFIYIYIELCLMGKTSMVKTIIRCFLRDSQVDRMWKVGWSLDLVFLRAPH